MSCTTTSERIDDYVEGTLEGAALHEVELHLTHRALNLHQRQPMRLVKDLAADRQQILQPLLVDHVVAAGAEPRAERSVGADDRAVRRSGEQPARHVVVLKRRRARAHFSSAKIRSSPPRLGPER